MLGWGPRFCAPGSSKRSTLSSEVSKALLRLLLRHQVAGSRELAATLILDPPPGPGRERDRMLCRQSVRVSAAKTKRKTAAHLFLLRRVMLSSHKQLRICREGDSDNQSLCARSLPPLSPMAKRVNVLAGHARVTAYTEVINFWAIWTGLPKSEPEENRHNERSGDSSSGRTAADNS